MKKYELVKEMFIDTTFGNWYITKHDDTDAPFNNFYIPAIESMAPEAAKAGMRIINCTKV